MSVNMVVRVVKTPGNKHRKLFENSQDKVGPRSKQSVFLITPTQYLSLFFYILKDSYYSFHLKNNLSIFNDQD